MAISYCYQDALDSAKGACSVASEGTQLVFVVNNAISRMWRAYDWRGTVDTLPPFWLVPLEQDYGFPTFALPTDFWGLRETYLVQPFTQNSVRAPMRVVENLERTSLLSLPASICYRGSVGKLRVHPCPPPGVSCPNYLVDGTYKIRPPKITRTDLSTPLLWDDVYFQCFVAAVVLESLIAAGRRNEAKDQLGLFLAVLDECTSVENQELGEPIVHPAEGEGYNRGSYLGFGNYTY